MHVISETINQITNIHFRAIPGAQLRGSASSDVLFDSGSENGNRYRSTILLSIMHHNLATRQQPRPTSLFLHLGMYSFPVWIYIMLRQRPTFLVYRLKEVATSAVLSLPFCQKGMQGIEKAHWKIGQIRNIMININFYNFKQVMSEHLFHTSLIASILYYHKCSQMVQVHIQRA